MTHKSRNISLDDFFELLQLEYISYYVRYSIYPSGYREKYLKACEGKKKKIEGISESRCQYELNIFNSKQIRKVYFDKFFNIYGMPNFIYADENIEKMMSRWDAVYYFKEGETVEVRLSGTTHDKGVIVSNCIKTKTLIVNFPLIKGKICDYNTINKPYDINLF
jgi:hypothetical protein